MNLPLPNVRPAAVADFPALLGLMQGLARYEGYLDDFRHTVTSLERHGAVPEHPDFRALVVDAPGGGLAGMLVYYFVPFAFRARPTFYIKELFVADGARGERVGEALLREATRIAIAHDCAVVRWQVARWNEGARRFYERHGARPDEQWVDYQLDEAAMCRLAAAPDVTW